MKMPHKNIDRALALNFSMLTELTMVTTKKPKNTKLSTQKPQDELIPSPAKNLDLIEKKHQQIIEGACRLFFKIGFHNTTIRQIAVACGMSMGQLYHYISSKDDVLFMIYKHMQYIWFDHLRESGIESIQDPAVRLSQAVRCTLEFVADNKALFLFLYTETKNLDKRHLNVVLELDDKNVVGFWRRILRDAQVEKSVADAPDLFANLLSYLMVFLPLRGWNNKVKSKARVLDPLVEFILRGLGVNPPDLPGQR